MIGLELRGLAKVHPTGIRALDPLNLTVQPGEFVVLVGPSGCGKSTLLRLIAGLDQPSAGEILIDGQAITGLPPAERDVAMVFQNYALYPHMSVAENIGFGLRMRKVPREERDHSVQDAAALLGLSDVLARRPGQLSGGQRQRVALARAIVRRPRLFLFDEPLSNLDAALRGSTRAELRRLHAQLGATMLYVTHDQVEAMSMADRLIVMRAGAVQQTGAPLEVYRRPVNRFVAGFIGTPPMNFLSARIADGLLELAGVKCARVSGHLSGNAVAGFRAEYLSLAEASSDETIPVTTVMAEPLGNETLVTCVLPDGQQAVARSAGNSVPRPGTKQWLSFQWENAVLFDPVSDQAMPASLDSLTRDAPHQVSLEEAEKH